MSGVSTDSESAEFDRLYRPIVSLIINVCICYSINIASGAISSRGSSVSFQHRLRFVLETIRDDLFSDIVSESMSKISSRRVSFLCRGRWGRSLPPLFPTYESLFGLTVASDGNFNPSFLNAVACVSIYSRGSSHHAAILCFPRPIVGLSFKEVE